MHEFFKSIFKTVELQPHDLDKLSGEFVHVVFLHILSASEPKLDAEDKKKVDNLMDLEKSDSVLQLLRSKHSETEWKAMLTKAAKPLIEDYLEKVAAAGVRSS